MKKILIATIAAAAAFAAISASADQSIPSTTTTPFGIECVRWDANALQIYCGPHPWNKREPAVITFSSIQNIYDHGYRVVSMHEMNDAYGYADIVIEKR